jgi:hypothetical protein
MKSIWSTGVVLLSVCIASGCSDDDSACVGPECSRVEPCTGAACEDMAGNMDVGMDVSASDMSQDAQADASSDMQTADTGTDLTQDAPLDMDQVFPTPAASTSLKPNIPFLFRDAESLANGAIAVGTTPDNFVANESREAVAIHYDGSGVVWSGRLGDPGNDQFTSVTRSGNQVLMAGLTRGYSVGASNNNDVLLVRALPTGFGEAFHWGTTGDEMLYGIIDGGQVAAWIGFGEAGNGDNRDGLVVAFDSNLEVLWATRFETGADEVFFDGAVLGNQVVAVGNTGVRSGTRRSLVAAVGNGSVAWARRGTSNNTDAISAVREGNQVVVSGNAASGSGSQPAIMQFAANGTVTGVRFDTAGTAHNIKFGDQRNVIAAFGANRAGMLITWDGTTARRLPLESQLRAAFWSTPIFVAGGQLRTVFQSANDSFVDLPFSLAPESSCSMAVEELNTNPVGAADFEDVPLTPSTLAFTGGAIANPRITPITTASQAMACRP